MQSGDGSSPRCIERIEGIEGIEGRMSSDTLVPVVCHRLDQPTVFFAPYAKPIVEPISEDPLHDCRFRPHSWRDEAGLSRGNTNGWRQRVAFKRDGEGVNARAQFLR